MSTDTELCESMRILMDAWTALEAKWIATFGTPDGFAEWFTARFTAAVQEPQP